jgi:excisionase family DNA binding protein
VETLLTVRQVAELLQISERSVRRHAARLGGVFPAGIRTLRFRRSSVEAACLQGGVWRSVRRQSRGRT